MENDELIKEIKKIPNIPSEWEDKDIVRYALQYMLSNSDEVEELFASEFEETI